MGSVSLDKIVLVRKGCTCLLYTSDAADDGESVDLGGRRIIKKKKKKCFFFFSFFLSFFFFQAEDGIRDQPRSRGLGDVYKRQMLCGRTRRSAPTQTTSTRKVQPSDAVAPVFVRDTREYLVGGRAPPSKGQSYCTDSMICMSSKSDSTLGTF